MPSAASPLADAAASGTSALGAAGFSWGGYFQAVGVLLLLLGLLWGAVWLMRKYGKFNFMPRPGGLPRDALRLEAQLPLGPRKGVMVVRFLNKRLLLGVTDHQITLLTESADYHDESNSTEFKDIFEAEQRQKTDN
ncbi:MAG: flagellar biosynthetic protein FliO [Desulfovibrionaceae bacterium]